MSQIINFQDHRINSIADADFFYIPQIVEKSYADMLFSRLKAEIDWHQDYLTFSGKAVHMPRLNCYYGLKEYRYSGLVNPAREFPEVVKLIRKEIDQTVWNKFSSVFNSVLLNYYRGKNDSISWHSDDETSLGENPRVVSFSLGAERVFKLRNKVTRVVTDLYLENGSLLIMGKNSQDLYQHCVLKSKEDVGERINLTFRRVV